MGDKLVKMVTIKNKVFFICILIFSFSASAQEPLKDIDLVKLHVSSNDEAYVVSFKGAPDKFTFKNIKVKKPKERILKKLRFINESDKYSIKVFDKDGKQFLNLGIGNPFFATYEHIGYEDRQYMGGLVNSADIEIALPLGTEPSYFVISKRGIDGKFNDFQQIMLP